MGQRYRKIWDHNQVNGLARNRNFAKEGELELKV